MLRFLSIVGLIYMLMVTVSERLSDHTGFAGPATRYVTTLFLIIAFGIAVAAVWRWREIDQD